MGKKIFTILLSKLLFIEICDISELDSFWLVWSIVSCESIVINYAIKLAGKLKMSWNNHPLDTNEFFLLVWNNEPHRDGSLYLSRGHPEEVLN